MFALLLFKDAKYRFDVEEIGAKIYLKNETFTFFTTII
jgi:hypothetical protein